MKYFSERLPISTLNYKAKKAPPSLRIQYLRDVFDYFYEQIIDSSDPVYIQKILSEYLALPLMKICDDICIQLNYHSLTTSDSDHYEYINDILRTCKWYEFYDIVEVIGFAIFSQDMEIIQEWDRVIENSDGDYPDIECMFPFFYARIRLEDFGFDTYVARMNRLLISTDSLFLMGDDGKLVLVSDFDGDNAPPLLPENQNNPKPSEKNQVKNDIEEFLEMVNSSKILEDNDRKSIHNSTNLFQENCYEDALKILLPSIEMVINRLIIANGVENRKFPGLAARVRYLEERGVLPEHITQNVDFIRINRNKIVHGDPTVLPELDELVYLYSIRWYKLLLEVLSE